MRKKTTEKYIMVMRLWWWININVKWVKKLLNYTKSCTWWTATTTINLFSLRQFFFIFSNGKPNQTTTRKYEKKKLRTKHSLIMDHIIRNEEEEFRHDARWHILHSIAKVVQRKVDINERRAHGRAYSIIHITKCSPNNSCHLNGHKLCEDYHQSTINSFVSSFVYRTRWQQTKKIWKSRWYRFLNWRRALCVHCSTIYRSNDWTSSKCFSFSLSLHTHE